MIGIYGLSEEEFNSLPYHFFKQYHWIDYSGSTCHGKTFDVILSYEPNIPKQILHDLRARADTHIVHYVKEIKEEECL